MYVSFWIMCLLNFLPLKIMILIANYGPSKTFFASCFVWETLQVSLMYPWFQEPGNKFVWPIQRTYHLKYVICCHVHMNAKRLYWLMLFELNSNWCSIYSWRVLEGRALVEAPLQQIKVYPLTDKWLSFFLIVFKLFWVSLDRGYAFTHYLKRQKCNVSRCRQQLSGPILLLHAQCYE